MCIRDRVNAWKHLYGVGGPINTGSAESYTRQLLTEIKEDIAQGIPINYPTYNTGGKRGVREAYEALMAGEEIYQAKTKEPGDVVKDGIIQTPKPSDRSLFKGWQVVPYSDGTLEVWNPQNESIGVFDSYELGLKTIFAFAFPSNVDIIQGDDGTYDVLKDGEVVSDHRQTYEEAYMIAKEVVEEDTKAEDKGEQENVFDEDEFEDDGDAPLTMAVGEVSEPQGNEIINIEEEKAWIKKVLGDIPVRVVDDLIQIGKNGGGLAYAIFHKAMITLSKRAPRGAGYHEAYHAVEELYLTDEQIEQLNKETERNSGVPSEREITQTKRKWFNNFGIGLSDQEAKNVIYSERRAEDFRVYKLTKGEVKPFSQVLVDFFNRINEWIKEVFFNELTANRLFDNIDRGYYAQQKAIPAKVEAIYKSQVKYTMEIPGFTQTQIENITNGLIFASIKSQLTGGIRNVTELDGRQIQISKEVLLTTLNARKGKVRSQVQRDNIDKIIANIDDFMDNMKDELELLKLREVAIKEQEAEEAQTNDEKNADVLAATKAAFESSGKDNATTNTRLLMAFVPLRYESSTKPGKYYYKMDPSTGLPLMANSSYVWNTTEALLSGIVTYTNDKGEQVYAFDQMVERLREYGEDVDPTFLSLANTIEGLKGTEKSAFHNAFSKADMNFLTGLYEEQGDGYKYIFFDSNVQSKGSKIFNSWKANFAQLGLIVPYKQPDGTYISLVDIDKLNKLFEDYDNFVSEVITPLTKGKKLEKTEIIKLQKLLQSVGIFMDLLALMVGVELRQKEKNLTSSAAFIDFASEVLQIFSNKYYGKVRRDKNGNVVKAAQPKRHNRFLFQWLRALSYTPLTLPTKA